MLSFNKLIVHNFGSYGHTELTLHNKGFCLVSGRNDFKKDNAASNGSGKSFLWNAICFALSGETLNGLHTNLKNINIVDDPLCYVTLDFTEKADSYEITRFITPKSDLKILKNKIDVSGKTLRESEKKLSELLPDITKDLIASTVIIGQGMPNRFSSFSPSGRKELLEKLTKADFMIEDIKQRVNTRLTELARQLRELEDQRLTIQSQLQVHRPILAQKQSQLSTRVKPDFTTQLAIKRSELDAQLSKKQQYESALAKEEREAAASAELQVNAIATKASEADAARKAYEAINQEALQTKYSCQAYLNSLLSEINSLEAVKDTCPTCGQHIPGAHKKVDLTEHYQRKDQLQKSLQKITSQIQKQEQEYQQRLTEINDAHDSKISALTQEAAAHGVTIANLRRSLKALEVTETQLREQLTRLVIDEETWDSQQQKLQSELESVQDIISTLASQESITTEALTEVNEHLKVVKKMDSLLKRDFRGFLLTNIIQYLDKKAKDYCAIVFGTRDLEIYLEGNALNIAYCGKMFDNLSGGEKQRVDLILQFTIRNMLSAYLNFNSNILVLDEITDFLDKKSCAAVLDLVTKELNTIESVFIVSHHASALALPIDSELIIRKNEIGISEIIAGA